MQVRLADTAGFCFGVKRAVDLVLDSLENRNGPILTLGPVIHNEQMMEYLREKGVATISSVSEADDAAVSSGTVVIRAHGVAPSVYEEIKAKGLRIIDATCPYVKKIHELVSKKSREGYRIFIAGDRNHPEVIGINGWASDEAIIFTNAAEAEEYEGDSEKSFLVAQTTMTRDKWNEIADILERKFSKLEKFDTICNATVQRLNEAVEMARQSDTVIVVGSRSSSNTGKLFEACKSYCKDTHLIQTASELPDMSSAGDVRIGVTAGASTPAWVIREVIEKVGFMDDNDNDFDFEKAFEETLSDLHQGDVVKGRLISFNGNEFFVDIGYKADGVIPMNEYTEDPFFDPKDAPKKGDEIEVLVVKVNDGDGNVILSKKRVESVNGMNELEKAYDEGSSIRIRLFDVTGGGLLAYYKGVRIFVPASQMGLKYVSDLTVHIGTEIDVRIVEFNRQKRRIIGSQRILLEESQSKNMDELWSDIQPGMKKTGTVKSFADFGAFIDLGGIDGLVHISELSWQKVKHPSEVLSIGDSVEATVIDFDRDKKRISLRYKKDEDDPWLHVSDRYKAGDVVSGKVIRLVPFGAFIQLDGGVDGLVHISQITGKRISKPDEVLHIGDEVLAKVMEVNTDSKKINLSIREADIRLDSQPPTEQTDDV